MAVRWSGNSRNRIFNEILVKTKSFSRAFKLKPIWKVLNDESRFPPLINFSTLKTKSFHGGSVCCCKRQLSDERKTFRIEFHMRFVTKACDNYDGWRNNCAALFELPIIILKLFRAFCFVLLPCDVGMCHSSCAVNVCQLFVEAKIFWMLCFGYLHYFVRLLQWHKILRMPQDVDKKGKWELLNDA